ncbi:gluconokinase [Streptomonospora litoralis]|uniref:Gluconokinase n=1 Tax=Streptomonospora litoralis TaxID=2498135 RepID=A0A4P6Q3Q9_9ACTN|nr:gluconokinase [Streptomonospora litoralis]QBI54850.1 Thermoresistant gluconokinase [Streptomonospora litoralis]
MQHGTHFVVMGVSGTGKSTVAEPVAERMGLAFAEADDFHPEANVAKMSAGTALTDDDRRPWLESLAEWIGEHDRRGESTIMACSALKRAYRDVLRSSAPDVRFLHLDGSTELIAERLRERKGHFMPETLLRSQKSTLEPLGDDEPGATLDITPPAEETIERAARIAAAALGYEQDSLS